MEADVHVRGLCFCLYNCPAFDNVDVLGHQVVYSLLELRINGKAQYKVLCKPDNRLTRGANHLIQSCMKVRRDHRADLPELIGDVDVSLSLVDSLEVLY